MVVESFLADWLFSIPIPRHKSCLSDMNGFYAIMVDN